MAEICQHKKLVAKTLVARNLEACFNASTVSDKDTASEGSGFVLDLSEDYVSQTVENKIKLDVERRFILVSESTQLTLSLPRSES